MGTFLSRNATSIPRNPQDWRLGGNGWVVVGLLLNFFRIFNFGKVVRNQVVILFVIKVLAEKLGEEVFLFLGWGFCWRTFTVTVSPSVCFETAPSSVWRSTLASSSRDRGRKHRAGFRAIFNAA